MSKENFEKSSNIKFRVNPTCGSRGFPCGRSDRHDDANNRLLQFCERPSNGISALNTHQHVETGRIQIVIGN